MDSRRDFIKKAGLIAGGALFPESIQKALAINPADGSTVWDADHVVILMQENRSFDHSYGALRGVRGFNDPRAMQLPNGNKVWLQTNKKGETFVPFRLNIKDTKATWMRDLPHSWENQVRARNHGKYDAWLAEKSSGNKDYKDIPLTLGYFEREDIPFYYSFADAFTVCDQNFSSSLTGTTPNRLYLWSGTIRENNDFRNRANVKNEDIEYDSLAHWKSFPERLEEIGIDWRIYQNEISLPVGFKGEESSWLANFTDNPIEWFDNYNVRFHPEYQAYLKKNIEKLEKEIEQLKSENGDKSKIESLENSYKVAKEDIEKYSSENFKRLSEFKQNLHKKAFTTNRNHADYHSVEEIEIAPGEGMMVPKGDVLYQFRKDVETGKLPPVSWLVAPQNFSDHPSAPWYGAWYVSETLEILTKNPEVWKKTVFILCYDENDGYYDHVPPFVAPHPAKPETGKASAGIDLLEEQVNIEHEKQRPYKNIEDGPIGLGYRVPLVIASPWSRGGKVCSEVFDHTSILQFLENFVQKRYKKAIKEENISQWRRTVCGNLSSVFTPFDGKPFDKFADKKELFKTIRLAKYKDIPDNFKSLSSAEIKEINTQGKKSEWMPKQENGTKIALPIPYELLVDVSAKKQEKLEVSMAVAKTFEVEGAPFFINSKNTSGQFESRHYTVKKGDKLSDDFAKNNDVFDIKVHGPNGFYRAFEGKKLEAGVKLSYPKNRRGTPTGNIDLEIQNNSNEDKTFEFKDISYHNGTSKIVVKKGKTKVVNIDLQKSHQWYDFELSDSNFKWHYAGHVETGKESSTDPAMA